MPNFVELKFKVTEPQNQNALNLSQADVKRKVFENARPMAKRIGESYQNNLKSTLARVGAIATGDTLKSVKDEMVLESPSRGVILRRVIASRSIIFVQFGRRPGKAPIRFVGTRPGKRKKDVKVFEPVPGLIRWFLALNIRRAMWMPIALAIGRRGIKPREVQMRAVRASQPAWQSAVQRFGIDFSNSLFKK